MTPTTGITYLPLADLYLSPLNPRQDVPEGDPEIMAGSLAIAGLLQNLIGHKDPERDGIGIVGGGRRLRGLQLLAERGEWDAKVPVIVKKTRDEAVDAAAAEGGSRVDLTPAQEIRLYGQLNRDGTTPEDIARAHGVTTAHVRQRLKLSDLPGDVIDALEARELTLDQARAFTLSDDATRIAELLKVVRGHDHNPDWIRRTLAGEGAVAATDRRAVFVGADAYTGAGGRILPDLFDTDRWLDAEILDRLFAEKLKAAAEEERERVGWAEVRVETDQYGPDHTERQKLSYIERETIDLPEADFAELERLSEIARWDRTPEERERIAELEARSLADYTDAQIAEGILWIWVDRTGKLCQSDAYRKPAPRAAEDKAGKVEDTTPEPPGLSQALREDLNRIATGALQAALIDPDNLDLCIALMVYEADFYGYRRATGIRFSELPNLPSVEDGLTLPEALTESRIENNDHPDAIGLAALLEGKTDDFLRSLQVMVARATSARSDDYGRALADQAGADIRTHWTPNAANFFDRCKGPYLDAVFAEIAPDVPEETSEAFRASKKADKAKALDKIFAGDADTRAIWRIDDAAAERIAAWLPEELRAHAPKGTPE
ncbi:ParB N-terminal domain-containing protein [Rhodobacterales bacterium HKCCE4037]|nr:ParB N-terminal domain-containing protein [Rhodobacterales bacterium HKCCE4037]